MFRINKKLPFKKKNRFYFFRKSKLLKRVLNPFIYEFSYYNLSIKGFLLQSSSNKFFFYNINKYFFSKNPVIFYKAYKIKKRALNKYKNFFKAFKYYYLKIKFYGKTFRWIFNKKKIRFKVQKAHKTFVFLRHFRFKRKRKLKLKIRLYLTYDFKNWINILKKIKYINLFTKKGLRVLKTKFYKKKGKISTYM